MESHELTTTQNKSTHWATTPVSFGDAAEDRYTPVELLTDSCVVNVLKHELPDDATAEEAANLVNFSYVPVNHDRGGEPKSFVAEEAVRANIATTAPIYLPYDEVSLPTTTKRLHLKSNMVLRNGAWMPFCLQILLYFICFVLLFAASWAVTGDSALPPDGEVFSICILYVTAVLGGWTVQVISLPPLLGQLLAGILVRNVPFVSVADANNNIRWSSSIRTLALTIILLRAGLGLDAVALKKLKSTVVMLAVIPVFVESSAYAVLTHFLLGFPWAWGFLLGFVVAAVSPAVIVPSMLNLQERGLGVSKGIPTLIMAAASFDDVIAIAGVGVSLGCIFSSGIDLHWQIMQGPLELVGGIIYGILTGVILWYIPSASSARNSNSISTLRFVLLCGFGIVAVFGSQKLGFAGAGALGCLTVAFVAAIDWRRTQHLHGHVEEINSATTDALLSWMWSVALQPLLFVLIGAEIAFERIDVSTLGIGLIILFLALIMRLCASVAAVSGGGGDTAGKLEWKERAFVAIAWLPKATVQAAVGPLAYDTARKLGAGEYEHELGLKVLTFAVMVILVTAPLGAIGINLSAAKLLTKSDDSNLLHGGDDNSVIPVSAAHTGDSITSDLKRKAADQSCAI